VFNYLVLGVGYCECTIDSPACACALRIVGKKKIIDAGSNDKEFIGTRVSSAP
jgi:hypothetical protein